MIINSDYYICSILPLLSLTIIFPFMQTAIVTYCNNWGTAMSQYIPQDSNMKVGLGLNIEGE